MNEHMAEPDMVGRTRDAVAGFRTASASP